MKRSIGRENRCCKGKIRRDEKKKSLGREEHRRNKMRKRELDKGMGQEVKRQEDEQEKKETK